MKSFLVHYKNVFPGGRVDIGEHSLDAYDAEGNHRIALRRTGAGSLKDVGTEVGASDVHCLDPIPKNARVFKLYADGKVSVSEEVLERKKAAKELAVDGKVLSINAYKEAGYKVDQMGNVSAPVQAAALLTPAE